MTTSHHGKRGNALGVKIRRSSFTSSKPKSVTESCVTTAPLRTTTRNGSVSATYVNLGTVVLVEIESCTALMARLWFVRIV